MFCTQCGFKLEDDMKVCPICGQPVEKAAQEDTSEKNSQAGGFENQGYTAPSENAGGKAEEKFGETGSASGYNYGNQPAGDNSQYGAGNSGNYSGYNYNNTNNYNGANYGGNDAGGQQNNSSYYGGFYNQPQKKKSGAKPAIIAIVCVVVVAAAGAAAFALFGGNSETSGKQDFEPYTNSTKEDSDDSVYSDYGDSPFYDNPFTEDGSEEQTSEDVSIYKGTVNSGVYENEYFGLKYSIPQSYYCLTEDEIIQYYGDDNNDMLAGVVGLDIVGDNLSEMVIYSQRIGDFSAEFYLRTFISNTLSGVDDGDYIVSDAKNVELGGVSFVKSDVEFVEYDPASQYKYNTYYVAVKDGVFLVISAFYDDTADFNDMISNFM